ncbi:hypothetical protein ES288_D06G139600v1 [Gossypium darwinii]|uniref:Uncharacterized protein n=1 Tax=Gossypium darwinii TaxID=34276 RepID=A0A5D2C5H1_GOSDA|nr:hypothetical protein ES288_D06G139600v1 [Gossypium darwinii]
MFSLGLRSQTNSPCLILFLLFLLLKPKVLTIEDKLIVLGCKDLERRIVEVEMDLTLAKSQGYLKHQLPQSESYSQRKLLAIIGVYTGFGSWMPRGDALKKLEERGVVIRFVIGRSANRGDSLDCHIDEENSKMKDFFILEWRLKVLLLKSRRTKTLLLCQRNMSSLKDVVRVEEVKSSDEKLSEDEYAASKDKEITGKTDL